MYLSNPYRGAGMPCGAGAGEQRAVADPMAAEALYARCPRAGETPLVAAAALAERFGIGALHVKDERGRMGLGSFKALGAAHAIARAAEEGPLDGVTFVTASAGNHGISVAAGAAAFAARSVIYLSETVPEAFAGRLTALGAEVRREGAIYEDSMAAAAQAAEDHGWELLSDSTWPGYTAPARAVMEGYLIMGAEARRQIPAPPSHIFLQAGVGGMAAAMAGFARHAWGEAPRIIVVEPSEAPCLVESIRAGGPVAVEGAVSTMGRLDCKEPSILALAELARAADAFMTVTDGQAAETVDLLDTQGFASTPSGAGGLAGLMHLTREERDEIGLGAGSRVLCFLSEGPE
ncbi:MAG: pyridoxal-phosphate dependent enzyme [Pseudomonadota bacterium]